MNEKLAVTRKAILQRCRLSTLMAAVFIAFNLVFLAGIVWLAYQSFSSVTFTDISRARLALLNESTRRGFDFIPYVTGTAYSVVSDKNITDLLEAPAASKYEMVLNRRKISEKLQHMLVVSSGISSIEIYSDAFNGVPYSSMDSVFPVQLIAGKEWFASIEKADAVWVSLPDNDSGESLIGYVQRIFSSKGKTIGYLLVRLSREDVLRNFADIPMVLDGQTLIVDTAGKIILKVNGPENSGAESAVDAKWLRERSFTSGDGYELLKQGSGTSIVMFSKPSTVEWRLVQIIPTGTLLSGMREAEWYVLGIGTVSLLLSAGVAFFFIRNMIRPLRRMILEMKRLERGDFGASVTITFTEEYAQLSHGFNLMVSRLKELMESVRKESKAKREAQTSLLEAQIKPHFLYNTLDMIHWRAIDYNAQDISSMIMKLSRMLRIGLSGGKMFIRLRDELEHAQCYVDIQRERVGFPLEYTEQVDPEVKSCFIPKIILQPLIENAIIHGRRDDGAAVALKIRLEIREWQVEGKRPVLQIKLSDNGKGLPEGWEMGNGEGIGTRNVLGRIQLYCGPQYGLRITGRDGGGTEASILLPIIGTEDRLKQWLDGENR
ncbi:sensor histidine kinase [Paenibacillus sp. sptzw28]|uniref:sensor histidine kinase n=1 Tax=Paenibacillus sp. sptzw28 TaxID=715179 RepID=UPI001C6EB57E|nr:sensor histidine kinase [Paenibacillus sp. sptzw28]QYR19276.1 sensor histidine kinase [Paenibacillus sp. sptzw28]